MTDATEPQWLRWSRQLMAIAQNGLTYSNSPYDVERYEAVRGIAAEIGFFSPVAGASGVRSGQWRA
jgi:hypothetical protein